MKKIITFLAFVLMVGTGFGQTTIFSEAGGGSAPSGWSFTNNVTNQAVDKGSYWLIEKGSPSDVITTATYDLSSYTSAEFKVNIKSYGSGTHNKLLVEVSYDGGSTYSQSTETGATTTSYKTKTIALSSVSSQVKIRLSTNATTGRSIRLQQLKLTASGTASSYDDESIIEKTSGWSEPTNIAYASYSAASGLTTGNSIEVAGFTIKDGGSDGTDADAVGTILTDLTVDIANYSNIKALAIFNGTTNVAEVTSISASTSFSSINSGNGITAADEGTADFTIRATFNTTVTDNANLKFTISSATADGANGSTFAAADAGGATTDDTGDNNKLVVTADRLAFTANKPGASVDVSTNFNVEVEATDANGSRDLDATNSITLAKATGTGILSSATGLTQSLSSGVYSWTDVQYDTEEDFTIEAQTASLTNITSGTITCSAALRAWINEFHYDNDGTDQDEIVEVCIINASSYTLSDFTVTLYNGKNGASYDTKTVNDYTVGTTYDNVTVYYYNYTTNNLSIQNGAPDGLALSYDDGSKAINVLEFLSYEGNFTASDGPANGLSSTDVGVSENGNTPVGTSIGRVGTNDADSWEAGNTASAGQKNNKSDGGTQILPIRLLSFRAQISTDAVVLDWQTATETNNDFFSIERSYNAKDFEELGIVSGAGNSNTKQYYKYLDKSANLQNTIYYRLKQTDYDGKYTYSKIISVNGQTSHWELINSYVNDKKLILTINSTFVDNSSLEVMDVSGRIVLRKEINMQKGINTYRIDLNRYSNGLYFVRIVNNANKTVANTKLILK